MMGVGIADTELALTWDAEDLIFNSDSATNQLSKLRWREGDKLLHRNAWKAIHFSLWASISSIRARDRLDGLCKNHSVLTLHDSRTYMPSN